MMAATAVAHHDQVPEDVSPEDQARAAIYGLVSNLFYAAPGRELLATIAQAGEDIAVQGADSELGRAWRELQKAAAAADESALRQEYDDTFISTGRAPVFLYGSFYMAGFLMEKPVAKLRDELARLGFARTAESGETEDHISALCDVMRLLILGDETRAAAPVSVQREFFVRNIAPWYEKLSGAIADAESTDFYKTAAMFARKFFDLESQSFEMA
jgi:TorA maturation chaperone TorD